MNDLEKVVSLLSQQKLLYKRYEEQTSMLFSADDDAANNYITKRSELAIEIDNLKAEINKIVSSSKNEKLAKAVKCEGDYTSFAPPLNKVYNEAKEIYAYISRIVDKNDEILATMQHRKEEASDMLKKTQTAPKIKKYLGGMGSNHTNGIFTGNDKKI